MSIDLGLLPDAPCQSPSALPPFRKFISAFAPEWTWLNAMVTYGSACLSATGPA